MKTAIYIEDGVVQLIITPETKFERDALKSFQNEKTSAEVFTGSFYDCRGGWRRQLAYHDASYSDDLSLMVKIKTQKDEPGYRK
ncbi:unnamed protein product [marine sediment metagenome]|uniref:Uncharacterized protein n=1 Tax=marine sediment metagenome TaxID=412755 RepID=X1TZY4_9ZZZZ